MVPYYGQKAPLQREDEVQGHPLLSAQHRPSLPGGSLFVTPDPIAWRNTTLACACSNTHNSISFIPSSERVWRRTTARRAARSTLSDVHLAERILRRLDEPRAGASFVGIAPIAPATFSAGSRARPGGRPFGHKHSCRRVLCAEPPAKGTGRRAEPTISLPRGDPADDSIDAGVSSTCSCTRRCASRRACAS